MKKVKTLMDGLFEEMNRVREHIAEYESLPNGAGIFGAAIMKDTIKMAEKAISDNDVIAMLVQYEQLKTYEA